MEDIKGRDEQQREMKEKRNMAAKQRNAKKINK